jgi:hypothetical protein
MSRFLIGFGCLLVTILGMGCTNSSVPKSQTVQSSATQRIDQPSHVPASKADAAQAAPQTPRRAGRNEPSILAQARNNPNVTVYEPEGRSSTDEAPQKVSAVLQLVSSTPLIEANVDGEAWRAWGHGIMGEVNKILENCDCQCELMIEFVLVPEGQHRVAIATRPDAAAPESLVQKLYDKLQPIQTYNTKSDEVVMRFFYRIDPSVVGEETRAAEPLGKDYRRIQLSDRPLDTTEHPSPDDDNARGIQSLREDVDRQRKQQQQVVAAGDLATSVSEARQYGWTVVQSIIDTLRATDAETAKGLHAWLAEFDRATAGVNADASPDSWPAMDVDSLTTNNATFWQGFFEIAPGDPAWGAFHAGLLMAGGELQRAQYVLLVARQNDKIPSLLSQLMDSMENRINQSFAGAEAGINRGIKLYDKGDLDVAALEFQNVVDVFPQCGLANYELGLTLFAQARKASGENDLEKNQVITKGEIHLPDETLELYARARRHDPLLWHAYQGSNPEVIRGHLAITRVRLKPWQSIANYQPVSGQQMRELGRGFQEAGAHDLALWCLQLAVNRRGRYVPEDFEYVRTSLTALASGPAIDATLTRLNSKGGVVFVQVTGDDPESP